MKRMLSWSGVAALMILALVLTGCNQGLPAQPAQAHSDNTANAAAAPVVSVPHQLYDASLTPTSAEKVKEIKLTVAEKTLEIAPGVPYTTWTFGGSVPGPILHVRQGDQVKFTISNKGSTQHSMDFHSAQTAWNVNYININPGADYSFTWTANYPGVFMYHCGTPPAITHIANGMYGAVIVEPAEGLAPAREYVLVQSEFYTKKGENGVYQYDGAKVLNVQPDYVAFNGYANQYKDNPLAANPGELVRFWILNAGPSDFSAFHIVGAIFDKTYPDGNPKNVETGRQTVTIPPGGGYMVELKLPDAGLYPIVTHSFADASKGALGILNVGNVQVNAGMAH